MNGLDAMSSKARHHAIAKPSSMEIFRTDPVALDVGKGSEDGEGEGSV